MERLTERDVLGAFVLTGIPEDTGFGPARGPVVDRLAEYEDLEEGGLLVRLPCKLGSTVFTVQERYAHCGECPHGTAAKISNPFVRLESCSWYSAGGHCPCRIVEHTVDGFEVLADESGQMKVSDPGKWGCEGLDTFSGSDGKYYLSREEAEEGMKAWIQTKH